MTTSERLEVFLSMAAASKMETIAIPRLSHSAISARLNRSKAARPQRQRWPGIAVAAALAIGLLFLPPVANAISRVAHTILTMSYFPTGHKTQPLVLGRGLTLEQARAITKFEFIQPQGLPAGYHLIRATVAPPQAARYVVTLRYAPSSSVIGLTMMESAVKPNGKPPSCRVLKWTRSSGLPIPKVISHYRGPFPPAGFTSVACHAWNVRRTEIQLVDFAGVLAPKQLQHIIQRTH